MCSSGKGFFSHHLFVSLLIAFVVSMPNLTAQSETIETVGDMLPFILPTTAFTSPLIVGDNKVTWQFAKGALFNRAIIIGLTYATHKKRPYNNGDRAFPSGHTSTIFQSAAFIQKRCGWHYGIAACASAVFAGYRRINLQKHDGWDVLVGAVGVIGSSYLFMTSYQKKHTNLTFPYDHEGYLLGFAYIF